MDEAVIKVIKVLFFGIVSWSISNVVIIFSSIKASCLQVYACISS